MDEGAGENTVCTGVSTGGVDGLEAGSSHGRNPAATSSEEFCEGTVSFLSGSADDPADDADADNDDDALAIKQAKDEARAHMVKILAMLNEIAQPPPDSSFARVLELLERLLEDENERRDVKLEGQLEIQQERLRLLQAGVPFFWDRGRLGPQAVPGVPRPPPGMQFPQQAMGMGYSFGM